MYNNLKHHVGLFFYGFLWQKRLGKLIKNASYFCFNFLKCCLSSRRSLQSSRSWNIPTISSFLYFLLTIWFATIQIQMQPNPTRGPSSLALNVLPFNAFFTLGLRLFLPVHCFDSKRIVAHFFVLSVWHNWVISSEMAFLNSHRRCFLPANICATFSSVLKWEFLKQYGMDSFISFFYWSLCSKEDGWNFLLLARIFIIF